MGWHEPDQEKLRLRAQLKEVQQALEDQLKDRALGRDQINHQSLEELEMSLTRIDSLLGDPSQLDNPDGVLNVKVFPDAIPQYLEDRKAQILNRQQEVAATSAYEDFENIVISELGADNQQERDRLLTAVRKERVKKEKEARRRKDRVDEGIRRISVEAEERALEVAWAKHEMWHSWLSRESIAAMVGGLLLLAFASVAVFAMFTDRQVPDVVQNTLSVILGYFFGSSVAKGKSD